MSDTPPCCEPDYPLAADGTARSERLDPALDPTTVQLDHREPIEVLAWAMAFANRVRYHAAIGPDGPSPGPTFGAVFGADSLITIAELNALDPKAIQAQLSGQQAEPAVTAWRRRLRAWRQSAPAGSEMASSLDRALIAFVEPDADPLDLLALLEQLKQRAPAWWGEMRQWPNHAPHVALLCAALELYERPRALLNATVARHLNYAYEEALGLQKRPPRPDTAHVVVEIARHVDHHTLPAGTLFSAGRDTAGQAVEFELVEETTFNRATLSEAHSLIVNRPDDDTIEVYSARFAMPRPPAPGWPGGRSLSTTYPNGPARIGFAVASPQLRLSGGERTITLSAQLDGPIRGSDAMLIEARYSAPDEWRDIPTLEILSPSAGELKNELKIRLQLGAMDPPCDSPSIPDQGLSFPQMDPVIRFIMTSEADASWFKVSIASVGINVTVDGLSPTLARGPDGPVDARRTFPLFGAQPRKGDVLTVEHPELLDRTIESLSIELDRVGSLRLDDAYENYPDAPSKCCIAVQVAESSEQWVSWGRFNWETAEQQLIEIAPSQEAGPEISQKTQAEARRRREQLQRNNRDDSARQLHDYVVHPGNATDNEIENPTRKARQKAAPVEQNRESPKIERPDEAEDQCEAVAPPTRPLRLVGINPAVRLMLETDLLHDEWPRIMSRAVAKQAAEASARAARAIADAIAGQEVTLHGHESMALPGPPMVLRATKLRIGYKSQGPARLFHIDPFGVSEPRVNQSGDKRLLPPIHELDAAAYFGFEDLVPHTKLSMLIQVLEGSEDSSVDEFEVEWAVLTHSGWSSLEGAAGALEDGTDGLRRSGLVRCILPANTAVTAPEMPGKLGWLRLSIMSTGAASGTARFGACTLLDARAQAAAVRRVTDLSSVSLPPGQISRLVRRHSAIKSLSQPYASFGGRRAEAGVDFYRRAAERLRHKDRAVTAWDYERLVLEAFPSVFKVRCLIHTRIEGERRIHAPGCVTLVVLGRLPDENSADPYAPRVSSALRLEIERFVAARAPLGATVRAINAHYIAIEVKAEVVFGRQADPVSTLEKATNRLVGHLAPWTRPEAIVPAFGGRVHVSQLMGLIDRVPGVIAARGLRMSADGQEYFDTFEVTAPHTVITSAPKHALTIVSDRDG